MRLFLTLQPSYLHNSRNWR